MANPELKSTSSSSSNLNNSGSSSSSSTLRDIPKMGEKMINEASPRVRETIDQVSDVANDLYGKASSWLNEGNNRNYGFIALAATAGVVGFFIGRGFRSNSSEF